MCNLLWLAGKALQNFVRRYKLAAVMLVLTVKSLLSAGDVMELAEDWLVDYGAGTRD